MEIATRKYNGQIYTFFINKMNLKDGRTSYISCRTPENCFGYPDTVLLSSAGKHAYTIYRYLPPYILRKIEAVMKKLEVKHCK